MEFTALKAGTRDWIRITGKAIESTSPEEKRIMLKECPILLKRFDSEEDKSFVLIKIVETESLLFTEHGVEELN